MLRHFLCLLLLIAVMPVSATEPPLGTRITELSLPDVVTGKTWSLLEQGREAKAVVVVFLGTECPVSNAFVPTLLALEKEYRSLGVILVGIDSNAHETRETLAKHVKEFEITFPMLQDTSGIIAERFHAERLPTAYVLDGSRTVRYQGRIDDQFERSVKRPQPTSNDLRDALKAVLADKEVVRSSTKVVGCPINREGKKQAPKTDAPTITYSKQVSRIIQNHCQYCHRAGEVGPFQLNTYQDALAWSGAIREVVTDNIMPPWLADPQHGQFANDRRLPAEDKQTLLNWIDQGCPEGNKADLPAPRQFVQGWGIGQPDEIITMNEEVQVPAQAPQAGIPYKHLFVGKPFTEDRYVQAAEVRPGYRGVVHHIIVYILRPGQKLKVLEGVGNPILFFANPDIPEQLVGFVPGDQAFVLPEGQAKLIPKGSQLAFEIHYTPNGKAGVDRSTLGISYAKTKPKHIITGDAAINWTFQIPPNDSAHKVVADFDFDQPVMLLSMAPHMHLRGKSFEFRLRYPGGKEEVLLNVPHYDFNWQQGFILKEPKLIPKGSKMICTAHFDNSKGNPNNPDPTKRVVWGDQTWHEMMIGFFEYYQVKGVK
ncbi:MAG TPA: redoxin domain-containing protein [Gemmatales bacterium]|nr:redoxin domain-containing protein [Gemmatales bacterium]